MNTARTSFPRNEIRVLLLENIHQTAHQVFGAEGFQIETVPGALSEAELCERIAGVHILGIRSKTRVTAKVLAHGKRLLSVGAFCIGTNQIELDAANQRGVPVFNAPFSNTRSVAELIIAEVVALARQLCDRSKMAHEGKWRKSADGSYEVRGKTLGIVGYGHIGSQVGVLAEAMGMRVLTYDIRTTMAIGGSKPTANLGELLEAADFVGSDGRQRGNGRGLGLVVHGHHREEAAVGVAHHLRADVLGDDLDADLHRRGAGVIHRGQEGDQLAHVDGLAEGDLVHRQRDDIAAGIAAGAGVGHLVEQLEDGAAVHIAGEVGHVGRHQHRHAELVGGHIHDVVQS